jgi:hypothetical protein
MKLNVGGQQTIARFPDGWTCLDILPGADILHDLTCDPIPLKDDSVEAIYCSHVLEHILPWKLPFVLTQLRRILVPGRSLRVVVPDMDIAIDQFMEHRDDPKALDEYMRWWFDPTPDDNGDLYLNHVGGFNFRSLRMKLMESGFAEVWRCRFSDCSPVFEGCDNPGHKETSLYVEAVK